MGVLETMQSNAIQPSFEDKLSQSVELVAVVRITVAFRGGISICFSYFSS